MIIILFKKTEQLDRVCLLQHTTPCLTGRHGYDPCYENYVVEEILSDLLEKVKKLREELIDNCVEYDPNRTCFIFYFNKYTLFRCSVFLNKIIITI